MIKKKSILGRFFIGISLIVLTVGCGGGGDSSPENGDPQSNQDVDYSTLVHSLDLSGAQGIYITGDSSSDTGSRSYSAEKIQRADSEVDLDANSVYKITADGRLERVAIKDENGNELPRASVKPAYIKDLNSLYLIMWLELVSNSENQSEIEEHRASPYLIHKSTGLAYEASKIVYDATKTGLDKEYQFVGIDIQWDENNNFYVKRSKMNSDGSPDTSKDTATGNFESIYKIDTSTLGSGSLTVTELPSAYSFQNTKWMVDKTGEFIVFGNTYDDLTARYLSITTGAIHNINVKSRWVLGLDNKIYTYSDGMIGDENLTWYRIESDTNNQPLITEVANSASTPRNWVFSPESRYVIGGKLIYTDGESFDEVDPINGTVFHHSDSFPLEIKEYVVGDNDIIILGKLQSTNTDGIYKYNVVNRTGELISVDSGFDVQKFKVLANGNFIVEGIRLVDQAYFYGELKTDGTVRVISTVAIGTPTVLVMEAIHPADFMLIDGSATDWSIDLRVLNDASADSGSSDGELLHYSQTTTSTQYFGMIEHGEDFNQSYYLQVIFEDGETLQFKDNNITFSFSTLSDAGGISSRGSVIEFSMPIGTVTTANVRSVELFGQSSNGDINTSNSIDKMPN